VRARSTHRRSPCPSRGEDVQRGVGRQHPERSSRRSSISGGQRPVAAAALIKRAVQAGLRRARGLGGAEPEAVGAGLDDVGAERDAVDDGCDQRGSGMTPRDASIPAPPLYGVAPAWQIPMIAPSGVGKKSVKFRLRALTDLQQSLGQLSPSIRGWCPAIRADWLGRPSNRLRG